MPESPSTRRNFLRNSLACRVQLALFLSWLVAQAKAAPEEEEDKDKDKKDEDISPAEDLMREHGVLNRLLLIYDEHLRMLAAKRSFDGSVLVSAADIISPLRGGISREARRRFSLSAIPQGGKVGQPGGHSANAA